MADSALRAYKGYSPLAGLLATSSASSFNNPGRALFKLPVAPAVQCFTSERFTSHKVQYVSKLNHQLGRSSPGAADIRMRAQLKGPQHALAQAGQRKSIQQPVQTGAAVANARSVENFRAASRTLLPAIPELQELTTCEDPDLLHLFYLVFCSQGVAMTDKVEAWIRGAGQACLALAQSGSDVKMLEELGKSLLEHAKEEAGHDRWFRDDVRLLSASWNAKHPHAPVSGDQLLVSEHFQSVRDYASVHEKYICGAHPYGQVAIQVAIEELSLVLGAPMLKCVRAVLGDAFLAQLTFLHHHVAIDASHTEQNVALRDWFLAANPSLEPLFADATYEILEVYGRFLVDCLRKAKEMRAAQPVLVA